MSKATPLSDSMKSRRQSTNNLALESKPKKSGEITKSGNKLEESQSGDVFQGKFTPAKHQLQNLRKELAIVKQTYRDLERDMVKSLTDTLSQTIALKNKSLNSAEAQRASLNSTRDRMEKQSEILRKRMSDLQDVVEELRIDVTLRKSKPSEARMTFLMQEALSLRADISDFCDLVEDVKPSWKKTWEDELQTIVREQAFHKDQEGISQDLEDDHADLLDVIQAIQQVVELQANTKTAPVELDVISADEIAEAKGGLFQEMLGVDADSGKRLKALEKLERMRQWEKENKVDEFQQELGDFVQGRKLKKTGGTEELDRARSKMNEQLLKGIYKAPS